MSVLRAATRGSTLARWQTTEIARLLADAGSDRAVEPVVVSTAGDRDRTRPLWEIGGKGVFVKEVQAAVLEGRADIAVHSAKDLPAAPTDGLTLACVPHRADARDVLVGFRLDDLAPGAVVATGSVRRRAQLAWRRPDLTFRGLRGNIATRLDQAGRDGVAAVVGSAAALGRLDLSDRVAEVLDPEVMLPQVGQGALAVECRTDDLATVELLARIEHGPSRIAVDGERAFLATLGGDCDLPAGAHATVGLDHTIEIEGLLASLDGHVLFRERRRGPGPVALGTAVATHLLDQGGRHLLER